ncbi:hypothetical protein F3J45_22255 [Pantoea sp. Ap-967]|uniref:NAD(P)/FAD-dependent oxidoreductase n=1 Tax=Pantoea sp. Ap-967 TaxID=2608362 RepID=UPI001422FBC4|nr:FAD-dependent oxidoreductase [Pantoea sp. Ap-967]NIE77166.1 hypothetical protein [Pantoea sp. Ap-967]
MSEKPIVIVGAGHSGAKAAAALRKHGWLGGIQLVGAEKHLPYDRPPLSKAVLQGKKATEDCTFFESQWFDSNNVSVMLGSVVTALHPKSCQVELDDGSLIDYHRLLLATGAEPRVPDIPGIDLENVFGLRTPDQARSIANSLKPGADVVILGGGVIGLEVAAVAADMGCKVKLVEATSQVMGRSVPEEFAKIIQKRHTARGVEIFLQTIVSQVIGADSVNAVKLSSGKVIPCNVLVYGVGVIPCAEVAESAGLKVTNGVSTDAYLATSDSRVFACGDVCNFQSRRYGQSLRLENWRNAEDQADIAARNMLGHNFEYDPLPWFWSSQYGWTIQATGIVDPLGLVGIFHDKETSYFINFSYSGKLVAAGALGAVRDVGPAIRKFKQRILEGLSLGSLGSESLKEEIQYILG